MSNRLSEHFTLGEMIKSQTATRLGIDNSPSEEHKASMKALCDNVLEPVRKRFGRPVIIAATEAHLFVRLSAVRRQANTQKARRQTLR